jgi:hypothetical protein
MERSSAWKMDPLARNKYLVNRRLGNPLEQAAVIE